MISKKARQKQRAKKYQKIRQSKKDIFGGRP